MSWVLFELSFFSWCSPFRVVLSFNKKEGNLDAHVGGPNRFPPTLPIRVGTGPTFILESIRVNQPNVSRALLSGWTACSFLRRVSKSWRPWTSPPSSRWIRRSSRRFEGKSPNWPWETEKPSHLGGLPGGFPKFQRLG